MPAHAESTAMAAETLYREQRLSENDIAERLSTATSTLYSYLRQRAGLCHPHLHVGDSA
jgi:hypothetical protein